jgi:DNA-binding IclR family transcriptional regulator
MRSVERMLDVLATFSTDEPSLTAAEISVRLALAPSTVRRILEVLERRSCVRLDPVTNRYSPFVEIVRLAAVATQGNDLIASARQPLDELRDRTGENVQLTVLVGSDVVFVDRRVSTQLIKIFSPIGYRSSAWDGRAAGQVLLAWLSEDERAQLVPPPEQWKAIGPNADANSVLFLERLAQVRALGYAINDEQTERDVWAVAAPVRDHTGEVIAAVSVPALKARATDPGRVTELIEATTAAALDISSRLNYFG